MNRETQTNQTPSAGTGKKRTSPFPFQLVNVRLYNINTERHSPEQEGNEEPALRVLLIKGDEPITAQEFSLWLEFETETPHGDAPECSISLSIEGRFQAIIDPETLKPEFVERFKTSDAILLLWPYLREAFHNITERMLLGMPPLPVIDARSLLNEPLDELVPNESISEPEKE